MLGSGFTDWNRKPIPRLHALADCPCNFGRRTEKMGATRNVGKGLIDGNSLDEGCEIADHLDRGVTQPLVFLELPAHKNELRTKFARLPSRHAATHPEGPGFVRSGKHDPTTDGDGFAAQRRGKELLYRGIEGIQVRMEDGGCRSHPDRPPVTFRGGSRRERT